MYGDGSYSSDINKMFPGDAGTIRIIPSQLWGENPTLEDGVVITCGDGVKVKMEDDYTFVVWPLHMNKIHIDVSGEDGHEYCCDCGCVYCDC